MASNTALASGVEVIIFNKLSKYSFGTTTNISSGFNRLFILPPKSPGVMTTLPSCQGVAKRSLQKEEPAAPLGGVPSNTVLAPPIKLAQWGVQTTTIQSTNMSSGTSESGAAPIPTTVFWGKTYSPVLIFSAPRSV